MEASEAPGTEGASHPEGAAGPAAVGRSPVGRSPVGLYQRIIGSRELEAEWAANYVYGVITTLVIAGSEGLANRPNPLSVVGVIVVGVGGIWLAHAFSRLVGDWIGEERMRFSLVWERLRHSWPILSAALPAGLAVGLAAAGVYSVATGLWVAEYLGVGALALIGCWAALVSDRSPVARVAFPVVLVALGWSIIGLELAAKHL